MDLMPLYACTGLLGEGFTQLLLGQTSAPSLLETITDQVWLWGRVALGIGFVIFVHELGHFLAAKFCGVKVEKFYVGFDVPISIGPLKLPRSLVKFRRGETEYGIGTIPLGGYVKMLGQDDDPRKAEAEAQRIRQAGGDATASGLDPRSYPAKKVWQRMIIISAGVVMNLITGVLYAAVAYMYGVPYMPAVVGNVTPGGPAYQAGIEPGGNVVTISDIVSDDNLYFSEMKTAIITKGMADPDQEIDVEIAYPDGLREYKLKTIPHPLVPEMRIIGIEMPSSLTLAGQMTPNSVASTVIGDQYNGAQIVAVDGQTLPGSGATDDVQAQMAFRKAMQDQASEPVQLTLLLPDGSKKDVEIPAAKLKLPGMHFSVGPVTALVRDGVAAKAGVKVGDQLVAINDRRDLDAFALPEELSSTTEPVKMTFRRGGSGSGDDKASEEIELTLTPATKPHAYSAVNESDNTVALKQFDFAYQALPTVASLISEAGAAEGLQPGDVLRSLRSDWQAPELADPRSMQMMQALQQKLNAGYELSAEEPLALVIEMLQLLPEGTEFSVMALRDGKVVEGKVKLVATDLAWDQRGLVFRPMERTHVASGFGEALSLGLRESGRRLSDVFRFLQMLVTGRVAAKNIGGPITIFQVAGIESSQGVSRLLMFLTMLSMNLAILNFLPIPALDGGHMVFLIFEAILGRPVDENLQMKLTFAGVVALLSLMAFALFNDVTRLLS